MSCYNCPLKPAFLERIEERKINKYAELEVAYDVVNVIRSAEAQMIMYEQPAVNEFMSESDIAVLKSIANLLEASIIYDRANYLAQKNEAMLDSIDDPERFVLESEDLACDGAKRYRLENVLGRKKAAACSSLARILRAKEIGIGIGNSNG